MQITNRISLEALRGLAKATYGDLVKVVVDLAQQKLVAGVQMHYDGEQIFLENGSRQEDLWGINLYPADFASERFIEFDSMINIRPSQGNPSREVRDPQIQQQIRDLVNKVVYE